MRLLSTFAIAAGLLLAAPALAQAPVSDPSDMVRGSAKAPITIVEYASVGCPHCAKLHNEVFPAFKKKYIDTGKVRWVAREVITGDPRVASGGFVLARCVPKEKYFDVTDAIYRDQEKVFADPRTALTAIAKSVGMTDEQFNTCVTEQKNYDALDARTTLAEKDNVHSTPTLMIKGKVVSGGEMTLDDLDKVIATASGKAPAKPGAKPAAKPVAKPAAKTAPKPTPSTAPRPRPSLRKRRRHGSKETPCV
jgi:protein-disulfide isomerase